MEIDKFYKKIETEIEENKDIFIIYDESILNTNVSDYLIEQIKKKKIAYLISDGKCSIKDIAFANKEMQVGKWMNQGISKGARLGFGYAKSLGAFMEQNPEHFPLKEKSIIYQSYIQKIPSMFFVTIGAESIYRQSDSKMAELGASCGVDLKKVIEKIKYGKKNSYINLRKSDDLLNIIKDIEKPD